MSSPSAIPPLRVALYEPRIPPNTGNIARTCAAFNLPLSLIEPLGFSLNDRYLRRAGLDYWPHVNLSIHADFTEFREGIDAKQRLIACSRFGGTPLASMRFRLGDVLLFGREDIGLPDSVRQQCAEITTISMPGAAGAEGQGGVRSLNLSVACALVSYEAGRQIGILQ
ncbi:MAG TPA: tRNA (cytidine(34)-2'-O)-methyltransferase [Prochlorococcus sp.]|jgi:tRNA (cytidine/uridine-2'-O-)-methyltransferase